MYVHNSRSTLRGRERSRSGLPSAASSQTHRATRDLATLLPATRTTRFVSLGTFVSTRSFETHRRPMRALSALAGFLFGGNTRLLQTIRARSSPSCMSDLYKPSRANVPRPPLKRTRPRTPPHCQTFASPIALRLNADQRARSLFSPFPRPMETIHKTYRRPFVLRFAARQPLPAPNQRHPHQRQDLARGGLAGHRDRVERLTRPLALQILRVCRPHDRMSSLPVRRNSRGRALFRCAIVCRHS